IGNGVIISGDCLFLGRCGRTDLFGGDLEEMHQSLIYLKSILQGLPKDWLVLPGHQYSIPDGSIPTFLSVSELLNKNEALIAAGNEESFNALEFLAFDDSLAEKARRKKARNQS
ncbi:MAG: MBL fold metallo-hydrolase, partial [Euryarchaeota archaeon]|nr:MBL fold metallo-hydrolase [Euryarchaeota archaeon]